MSRRTNIDRGTAGPPKRNIVSKRRKTYIKKSKTGPQGHDEWVVRIELDYGDYAICGCPGRWEAEFVKQCISAAIGSPNPSVRLERMLKELEETF